MLAGVCVCLCVWVLVGVVGAVTMSMQLADLQQHIHPGRFIHPSLRASSARRKPRSSGHPLRRTARTNRSLDPDEIGFGPARRTQRLAPRARLRVRRQGLRARQLPAASGLFRAAGRSRRRGASRRPGQQRSPEPQLGHGRRRTEALRPARLRPATRRCRRGPNPNPSWFSTALRAARCAPESERCAPARCGRENAVKTTQSRNQEDSSDNAAKTTQSRQCRQDNAVKTTMPSRQRSQDNAAKTMPPRQRSQDNAAKTTQSRQRSQDNAVETTQSRQCSRDNAVHCCTHARVDGTCVSHEGRSWDLSLAGGRVMGMSREEGRWDVSPSGGGPSRLGERGRSSRRQPGRVKPGGLESQLRHQGSEIRSRLNNPKRLVPKRMQGQATPRQRYTISIEPE